MPIFGDKNTSKNKVYYRRKSIRLNNYAIGFASAIMFGATIYFVSNRDEIHSSGVDELSTSMLRIHEPFKYYYFKYFGGT